MKLKPSETALVIAGAWNTAILTPDWVMRHCLDLPPGSEMRVQAAIPTGFAASFEFPRFTLGELTYTSRPDALVISPVRTDENGIRAAETVAQRVLETLLHTPVGGMGHNFEFHDEQPNAAWLQLFTRSQQDLTDVAPEGWAVQSAAIATAFESGGRTVNVTRLYRDGRLTLRFNFHHPVSDAAGCASILRRESGQPSMFQNLVAARQLVEAIYGGLDEQDEPEAGA